MKNMADFSAGCARAPLYRKKTAAEKIPAAVRAK
jgi:hypothetical protein